MTRRQPIFMLVVGDWTVPPDHAHACYDKRREVASQGYYAANLDSFHIMAELTATRAKGMMRLTFPRRSMPTGSSTCPVGATR